MQGIELRIKGKVQGVGFRPFVWLLANQYELKEMSIMMDKAC